MIEQGMKVVMIIDETLPPGLIANTAAVLALTLGKQLDHLLGPDIPDGTGQLHVGITTTPIPILRGTGETIKALYLRATDEHLFLVDFSNAAQTTKDYDSYAQKLAQFTTEDLSYLGIALYGKSKLINKLTGSMPLLR